MLAHGVQPIGSSIVVQSGDAGVADDLVSEVDNDLKVVVDGWSAGLVSWQDVLAAAGVAVVAVAVAWLVRRLVRRSTRSWHGTAVTAAAVIAQLISVGIYLFAVAIVLEILGFSLGPVLVLSVLAIVVVLFLRPVVQNLSAGLLLQLRGFCQPGDVVEVDGELGVVQEVSTRSVVLLTTDGRTVHVPNAEVIDNRLVNYSVFGRRRSVFSLRVPDGADIEALTVGLRQAMAASPLVIVDPAPEVVVTGFDGAQVLVELRFWHPPELSTETATRNQVGRALVELFDRSEPVLADPALRVELASGD